MHVLSQEHRWKKRGRMENRAAMKAHEVLVLKHFCVCFMFLHCVYVKVTCTCMHMHASLAPRLISSFCMWEESDWGPFPCLSPFSIH